MEGLRKATKCRSIAEKHEHTRKNNNNWQSTMKLHDSEKCKFG
jgi:hypothetical protein